MTINIATVFSGIGAPEYALKQARLNYKVVFACDIDKFAKQTYFANFDINESQWYNDIYLINGKKYKNKIDLFVGGSPCQSFSKVGNLTGFKDKRGLLFFEYIRLIKEMQPKVFIYENVANLISHENGKTIKTIFEYMHKLKYTIYSNILNAKDYGIPQNRKRFFIIGFKNKRDFNFPIKQKLIKFANDFLEKNDKVDKKYISTTNKIKYAFEYHKFNRKLILNRKILTTFTTNTWLRCLQDNYFTYPDTTKTFSKNDYEKIRNKEVNLKIRILTDRERFRLMGFKDDFKIVVSNTQAYKQTGNSIVINVLVELFNSIYKKKSYNNYLFN